MIHREKVSHRLQLKDFSTIERSMYLLISSNVFIPKIGNYIKFLGNTLTVAPPNLGTTIPDVMTNVSKILYQ